MAPPIQAALLALVLTAGAGDVKLMAAVGSLAACRAWIGMFLMSP